MINFLDVAGDNAASDLIAQFAIKAKLIILCYAINSNESFKELDDWLEAIDADPVAATLPIALVATKSDLEDSRVVSQFHGKEKKKEITKRGKETTPETWANNVREKCFKFAETSSFEDVAGVKTVFDDIGTYIVSNNIY